MQFTYEVISPKELTKTEKILLACKGEDFCCIRRNGVVKINKTLPNPKAVVKIAAATSRFLRSIIIENKKPPRERQLLGRQM